MRQNQSQFSRFSLSAAVALGLTFLLHTLPSAAQNTDSTPGSSNDPVPFSDLTATYKKLQEAFGKTYPLLIVDFKIWAQEKTLREQKRKEDEAAEKRLQAARELMATQSRNLASTDSLLEKCKK